MNYFVVKNWSDFQHYRDRNPPWIKLHFSLLTSEAWVMLDNASRVLAIASMLLASRNDGKVPADPSYLRRVAYLDEPIDFKPLVDVGFLIDPDNLLANASTLQADARPEKRRGETETEERSGKKLNGHKFTKPTIPEIREYCESFDTCTVDPAKFWNHYEAVGWKVGKSPMKDWKAAVRGWNLREK